MKTERDLVLPRELAEGYKATFERLCRMFRARGVPASETADLAQETITRTLLHLSRRGLLNASAGNGTGEHALPSLHPDTHEGGIEPLIKRIALNLLIDRARAAAPTMLPIEGADDIAEPAIDPGDEVARRQQRAQVYRAIDDLSSRHRTAMLLSLEGLTPGEIADHLGIQRNAADALLYRARRSLAKHLSAITGLIRGFAILVALRIRSLRRSEAPVLAEASWASHAVLGLSAATLGTVLAFTIPGTPDAGATTHMRPSVTSSTAATETGPAVKEHLDAAASEPAGRSTDTAIVRPSADVDVDDHSVRTAARIEDPATGEEEGLGIDLIHQRDEDDRGATGPLLDAATGTACSAAKACEE